MSRSAVATARAQAGGASAPSASGQASTQPSGKYYMCFDRGQWHLVGFNEEAHGRWKTKVMHWATICGGVEGTLLARGPVTCWRCLQQLAEENLGIAEVFR